MIFGILLFAAVGLTLGYAFRGPAAWIAALGLPTVVAAATVVADGFDDLGWVAFIVTMVLTGLGVVLGSLLRERGGQRLGRA